MTRRTFAHALAASLVVAACRDAAVPDTRAPRNVIETPLAAAPRVERKVAWAAALGPIEVQSATSNERVPVRLYEDGGEIDPSARAELERMAAREGDPHTLSPRLEQLVFKAAYHFKSDRIVLVSGWRPHAGRHAMGDALDFKLQGVSPWRLAAYLRGLPRVGVGLYTNPNTLYVHLDVREPSFYWIDASPPGVKWREMAIGDRKAAERDASWSPEMDFP